MIGKRRDFNDDELLEPGEYGRLRQDQDNWYGCTPNGHGCNLLRHAVFEHEDGTITVTPSILVSDHTSPLWHGYLERGIWREC